MDADLIIVGAGPAGLCLARALQGSGLRVDLIEPQTPDHLRQPAFDGREIALTHRSAALLQRLGLWQHLGTEHIAPLRSALVMNGPPSSGQSRMCIRHSDGAHPELGHLVGNHRIRQAAWQALFGDTTNPDGDAPTLHSGQRLEQLRADGQGVRATLSSGRELTARLMVAADSRYSGTRRLMGIDADLHDHGASMLVCQMTHDEPHHATAWEWFDRSQTLALLPMNPCPSTQRHRSSVVLTLPGHALPALMAMDDDAFGQAITRRFRQQLGAMRTASSRHVYPLVSVWARRFVAPRFALLGDAAVGMHPVTAHGYNLGLSGVERLTACIVSARAAGQDWGKAAVLAPYAQGHHRHAWPIFQGTNTVVKLFTDARPVPRLVRTAIIEASRRIPPLKAAIVAQLTGRSAWTLIGRQLPRPPFFPRNSR
jgi:ubiquinone biosynthesis UbiH/UbiF/VisC/COQ6 family hydroxylase